MKFVKRLLMGIGGLAAAAALLTAKGHAVAAAVVEVNTAANPAIA